MFVKCLFQMAGTDTAVLEQTSGKPKPFTLCYRVCAVELAQVEATRLADNVFVLCSLMSTQSNHTTESD